MLSTSPSLEEEYLFASSLFYGKKENKKPPRLRSPSGA
jgi:hypothetical protein